MATIDWILAYLIAAAAFLVIDLTWLGLVANGVYTRLLGDLKRDRPSWPAALAFYAIFVGALLWFSVRLAIDGGSIDIGTAALNGAVYGLATYATWDLTNAAVLRGFPTAMIPIDIAWGIVLSTSVATVTALCVDAWLL